MDVLDVEAGETDAYPDVEDSPPSYEETVGEGSLSPRSSSSGRQAEMQVDVVAELTPMLLHANHNLFGQGLMCRDMIRRLDRIENDMADLIQAFNLRFYISLLLVGLVGLSFIGLMIILFRVG